MHHWQDIVLASSFMVFNLALLPSVIGRNKPALGTSLLTTIFLIPGLVVYLSLSLWYAAIMTAINFLLWVTLVTQEYARAKKKGIKSKLRFWT